MSICKTPVRTFPNSRTKASEDSAESELAIVTVKGRETPEGGNGVEAVRWGLQRRGVC